MLQTAIDTLISEKAFTEKVIQVPTSAFASTYKPTSTELKNWVDTNVSHFDRSNGAILEYNPNPHTETTIWNDTNCSVYGVGDVGSISYITVNGIQYVPITTFNYDGGDNSVFDETAFQTFIEQSFASEGITATVSVTENFVFTAYTSVVYITDQVGLESFSVTNTTTTWDSNAVFLKIEDNVGSKEAYSMWKLNKDGDSYKITTLRKPQNANTWYISPDGDKDRAVKGSPNFPSISLAALLQHELLSNGDTIHYLSGNHVHDPLYYGTTSRQLITDFTELHYVFDQGCKLAIPIGTFIPFFKTVDPITSEVAPGKVTFRGYPDLDADISSNKFFEGRHPDNTSKIEIGRVEGNSGLLLYDFPGSDVDIHIKELDQYGQTSLYYIIYALTPTRTDAVVATIRDNATVRMRVDRLIPNKPSANDLNLFITNDRQKDISNFTYELSVGSCDAKGVTTQFRYNSTRDDNSSTFGFIDSTFKFSVGHHVDDWVGSEQSPYSYTSSEGLFEFQDRLKSGSVCIIENCNVKTGRHFFKQSSPGSDIRGLDNAKIIFRNLNIESNYNIVQFIFSDTSDFLLNNPEIVFENCNFLSNNSYALDFNMVAPTTDNTSIVRFKNCRIETKGAGKSLIHFRGDTLILEDCTLVNDGTTEDITSDAGVGTINLIARNTYSNCLTTTDTSFSLVAGDGINRDAQIV